MILIVDDQKDIGLALERLLRYAGHEAVAVTGGAEALAFLHVRVPAVMVLDLNMPDMDGLDVLRRLKGDDAFKGIPVVMYSADCEPDHVAEAKSLGATDFIKKGATGFDQVVARISQLAGEPPVVE